MIRRCLSTLLVAMALAACSGEHKIDETAWEADVTEALGHAPSDFQTLRDQVLTDCEERATADSWEMYVAVAMDGSAGTQDFERQMEVVRIGLRHACPDILAEFEQAIDNVRDLSADYDRICALPPAARTEEEQMKVEAVGCE